MPVVFSANAVATKSEHGNNPIWGKYVGLPPLTTFHTFRQKDCQHEVAMLRSSRFMLFVPMFATLARGQDSGDLTRQVTELKALVEALETRVTQLE